MFLYMNCRQLGFKAGSEFLMSRVSLKRHPLTYIKNPANSLIFITAVIGWHLALPLDHLQQNNSAGYLFKQLQTADVCSCLTSELFRLWTWWSSNPGKRELCCFLKQWVVFTFYNKTWPSVTFFYCLHFLKWKTA